MKRVLINWQEQKVSIAAVNALFYKGRVSQKVEIAYLIHIRMISATKLFVNMEQIRLLNDKTPDLDWYYPGVPLTTSNLIHKICSL